MQPLHRTRPFLIPFAAAGLALLPACGGDRPPAPPPHPKPAPDDHATGTPRTVDSRRTKRPAGGASGARAAIQEAASLAGGAVGARVVFMPAETSGGARIDITSGPDPESRPNVAAFTEWRLDALGYIAGGRIVFVMDEYLSGRQPRVLTTIMAPELGHTLGRGHSSVPG